MFRQDDECDGFFIVSEGKVKVIGASDDGRLALLGIHGTSDLLGLSEALLGSCYIGSAYVQEDALLLYVTRDRLRGLIASNPAIARCISEYLAAEHLRALRNLRLLRVPSPKLQKLAGVLVDQWPGMGDEKTENRVTHTHAELAQLIGVSRETVTRLLHRLHVAGIIQVHNACVHILDLGRLEGISVGTHTIALAS